jgi:hypothetical protein
MGGLAEIAAAASPLARVAANQDATRRDLLAAAEDVIGEIESAFHLACFEVATIGDRLYTRVPDRHRPGTSQAWLVNGRVMLESRDRYLLLNIRILNGDADPLAIIEEINGGRSQLATMDQLMAFSRDLPQVLERVVQEFPRRQLLGEEALIVTALRRAYHDAGVVLDWPAVGQATRFSAAEHLYRRNLGRQARIVRVTESRYQEKTDARIAAGQ